MERMIVTEDVLFRLKKEFREWCGMLSLEEIMSNSILVQKIREIEGLFSDLNLKECA